jgi:hypothetical protein
MGDVGRVSNYSSLNAQSFYLNKTDTVSLSYLARLMAAGRFFLVMLLLSPSLSPQNTSFSNMFRSLNGDPSASRFDNK